MSTPYRNKRKLFVLCFAATAIFVAHSAAIAQPLAWDATLKSLTSGPGQKLAEFTFNATNVSPNPVIVLGAQTTCGCTVAKLPAQPWVLAPKANGKIQVTVDLSNKVGTVRKGVMVVLSNASPEVLSVEVNVGVSLPPPPMMSEQDRARNAQIARANAQAVFKGSCASCHAAPAKGRFGAELYASVCGICHDAGSRQASMVPNLHKLNKPTDFIFWKNTIANGVTNSMMPAFAASNGGPLTDGQIISLAQYLDKTISKRSTNNPPAGR